MYWVTAKKLKSRHFCKEQIEKFKEVFPKGAPFTLRAFQKAQVHQLEVDHVFQICFSAMYYDEERKHGGVLPMAKLLRFRGYQSLMDNWPFIDDDYWEFWGKKKIKFERAKATKTLATLWKVKALRERVRDLVAVKVKV